MPAAPDKCPRCRYDLAGEIQTWQDRCPSRGLCPECGYSFAWSDLLGRARGPAWPPTEARRFSGRAVCVLLLGALAAAIALFFLLA